MRTIFSKATSRAEWLWIALTISGLLWGFAPRQTAAGSCSAARCSLPLTNSSFAPYGTFGTVTPNPSSNVVTIDGNLASAYRIVQTGFPGAVGFGDNHGGKLTIGNFKSGGVPMELYFSSGPLPPGCTSNDCHWNRFGYTNDAAATTAPMRSVGLQGLSFTVSKGTLITEVPQLLQRFIPSGGNTPAYLTVDAYA